MLPRKKLIQCFTCKNNLACWGLLEDIPLGESEKELIPTHESVLGSFRNLEDENVNLGEYFGIFSMDCLKTLRYDKTAYNNFRRDVYQMVFLLAALANSSNDGWVCPEEDETDERNFVYEER